MFAQLNYKWLIIVKHYFLSIIAIVGLIIILSTMIYMQRKETSMYFQYFAFRYQTLEYQSNIDEDIIEAKRNLNAAKDLNKLNKTSPDLVVTIVTIYRSYAKNQYFHLTLWSILRELRRIDFRFRVSVLLCHVGSSNHDYLKYIANKLPIVHRHTHTEDNIYDKERGDYNFCINQSVYLAPTAKHLLIFEDDSPIRNNHFPFFSALQHFIIQSERNRRRFAYLKLFHPPHLLGYIQPEWERHFEAISIAAIVVTLIRLICLYAETGRRCLMLIKWLRWHPLICVYVILLVYILDRFWVLELRRHTMFTHLLVPAPFCCTPGIVFQRKSALTFLNYSSRKTCGDSYKKDHLLYDYYREGRHSAWYIVPNLVEHVGRISTLE